MNHSNDSWRDSYDAWKLRSPYDERDDECFHEDYEVHINGRATCCRCGEGWYLTAEEIQYERERVIGYDKMYRRWEREQRWQQFVSKIAFWRRWQKAASVDDDIPF